MSTQKPDHLAAARYAEFRQKILKSLVEHDSNVRNALGGTGLLEGL